MNETQLPGKTVVMLLSNPYNPDDRVRNEAMALIELGCRVAVLAWDRYGKFPAEETRDGLSIRRIDLRAGYGQGLGKMLGYMRVWLWFVTELKRMRPDVVHCHDYDTYLAGIWHSLLHGQTRLVLDTHENYYMMMKPLVSRPVAACIGLLERLTTRVAHLLISSNEATAGYYSRFGARNVIVIGNWKSPQAYEFGVDILTSKRRQLGVRDGQLVVVYVGALSKDRNVIPLLEAVRACTRVFLVLGGAGDQEAEIRRTCARIVNAIFLGYVHPDDVPLLTALADVVYYGFDPGDAYAPYNAPNKLYEALAAGKAVIAGDLGGELSKVVDQTQCGLLLPKVTAEAIGAALDLLADVSVRSSMQERAKKAGQTTYNLSACQRLLQTAYSPLLGYQPC